MQNHRKRGFRWKSMDFPQNTLIFPQFVEVLNLWVPQNPRSSVFVVFYSVEQFVERILWSIVEFV